MSLYFYPILYFYFRFLIVSLTTIILSMNYLHWFIVLDLQDDYFHFFVQLAHRKYLRFLIGILYYHSSPGSFKVHGLKVDKLERPAWGLGTYFETFSRFLRPSTDWSQRLRQIQLLMDFGTRKLFGAKDNNVNEKLTDILYFSKGSSKEINMKFKSSDTFQRNSASLGSSE